MKFVAILFLLFGSFIVIWSVIEAMISKSSVAQNENVIDLFQNPWSGLILIGIGGSLLMYTRRKIN